MREKRLKLFLYDLGIKYNGELAITENLLLLLNTYIENINMEEKVKRFGLVFNVTKTETGYRLLYKTKELREANEALRHESIKDIIKDMNEKEIFEIGELASDFLHHIYTACYEMNYNPTLVRRFLN